MRCRALLLRLHEERAYSLVEMLTVLVIMGVVMGGLTTVFSSALNSEVDMNARFQAQQEARLALDKMRREIHCASVATPVGASNAVTITLPSYCKTGSGAITWCARNLATSRYALYRVVGSSCTGGVKWADHLTTDSLFNYTAQSTTSLAALSVDLPVNIKPSRSVDLYDLRTNIVLRNSTRS